MADDNALVPVWTLSTEAVTVPGLVGDAEMTPERLADLRTALATFAQAPIATLEMHPIERRRDSAGGIALHASSPLAQQLSQLVTQTARSAPAKVDVAASGEVLYRMVVPAKVASQVSKGLVKPMASKAVSGGVYSALRDSTGIVSKATFVPVSGAGATTGAAATAGVGLAGAGALTVAAPLVLMAVAVGASAYADHQRQKAIERITDLLEQLHDDKLEQERNRLDGCRDAIDKATSVLLDQGKIGQSLGLDSASHEISTAIAAVRTRLKKWQDALTELPEGPVELTALTEAFPGITDENGAFSAHLETARLAIALKRRVLVLQAVEHAQLDGTGNPFKSFLSELRSDEQRLNDLESSINGVLLRLSSLELKRPSGLLKKVHYAPSDVDKLLTAAYRLKGLSSSLDSVGSHADVVIEIERGRDGSVVVFPAEAIEA
ncbi:bifunctional 23S rRNA (guanine(2069)-N(7))-methyltransferase RlmK/23S rRNA (guanine(2445)-N(2))-methyltransferase RlmL [Haematomicrobium sanguinis]|uniref:bifunctional 23S rRNA (guanine(2069)-N(7))-methyltransferase RlmK/23S rRNA (guanine(2445)-N(2))-methyltransferase RlmL n=1 Tax=Haematomicrobium sanguinis TaxID=479106 RepID=UPI00047EB2D2|nr:bifunctional 23S rRNA (guanine(2069)-N(7))-methyltransferase RlmK/23S rRNA (guanine(2445)-N(2))-methyltransferase RlmL [Haematomicrobium sanguinis]